MRILCISSKTSYGAKRLTEEAKKLGLVFRIHSPREVELKKGLEKKFDLLYVRQAYPNFPGVIGLAKKFKKLGKTVVDSEWTDENLDVSKTVMYKKLEEAGLPIPETNSLSVQECKYPIIVKWNYGFGGKHVWLVRSKTSLERILKIYPRKELLAQEFIASEYEYKVVVVGYKALPFVVCYKIDKFRLTADLNKFKILKGQEAEGFLLLAEQASRVVGRALSKVDIIDSPERAKILEVNRSPGLEPIEQASGVNIFKSFVEYLSSQAE